MAIIFEIMENILPIGSKRATSEVSEFGWDNENPYQSQRYKDLLEKNRNQRAHKGEPGHLGKRRVKGCPRKPKFTPQEDREKSRSHAESVQHRPEMDREASVIHARNHLMIRVSHGQWMSKGSMQRRLESASNSAIDRALQEERKRSCIKAEMALLRDSRRSMPQTENGAKKRYRRISNRLKMMSEGERKNAKKELGFLRLHIKDLQKQREHSATEAMEIDEKPSLMKQWLGDIPWLKNVL